MCLENLLLDFPDTLFGIRSSPAIRKCTMRYTIQYLFLLLLLFLFRTAQAQPDCVKTYEPGRKYFPHQTRLLHSKKFSVEYFGNYKVVTVLTPWPEAKEQLQYVLVQCGTPSPEGYPHAQRIQIPAGRVISMSTTQLPHLEILDAVKSLIAVSDIKPIHSSTINRRFQAGHLAQVGHGASVNLELVLELETDLVMATATSQAHNNAHPVLQQANIPVIVNAEYTEASVLGRAEWIKFTAAFFNKEQVAEIYINDITAQYAAYAALTRDLPTEQRPTVFGGALWRDIWYISGGKSYPAQLIQDAGGLYLWADDDSRQSLPLDFESVYDKAHAGDIWLTMHNQWQTLADIVAADERYASFATYANGRLYNANARLNEHGGNDYWESSTIEPHILLADLIKIFHPDRLPDHQLKYYQKMK